MKIVFTLLCLLCIGFVNNSPEKTLVENSLRHKIFIAESPDQKMNILDRMHYYNVPGVSIAIVNNGKIDWASGYGTISNDTSILKAIDKQTLFQAGSISKSLTAYGALLLVQQGIMDLDEDVIPNRKSNAQKTALSYC